MNVFEGIGRFLDWLKNPIPELHYFPKNETGKSSLRKAVRRASRRLWYLYPYAGFLIFCFFVLPWLDKVVKILAVQQFLEFLGGGPVFVFTPLLVAGAYIGGWYWAKFARQEMRAELALLGLCPGCGYNLTGNTSGTCPECGKPI